MKCASLPSRRGNRRNQGESLSPCASLLVLPIPPIPPNSTYPRQSGRDALTSEGSRVWTLPSRWGNRGNRENLGV
jgi:hypothetical protein